MNEFFNDPSEGQKLPTREEIQQLWAEFFANHAPKGLRFATIDDLRVSPEEKAKLWRFFEQGRGPNGEIPSDRQFNFQRPPHDSSSKE